MTGVDISDHAIGIARDLSERQDLPVDYHLADARDLSEFQDASFDLVLAVNSLCSFGPDRSVMGEISAEIHRLLTPGGALVAVIPHPAFEHQQNCPTRHRRFPDGYSYFNGGTLNTLSLTINQKKAEFDNTHWTLEDYSGFFRDRFLISDICEPVPDDTFDAVHPEMFAQATRYPIYMLLKCVACPK
jgi:SAM-dependent methyltransferase